ncbi:MAG TPA: vanadium-dependent haloperoxidase [Chryseolinea sp.]
MKKRSFKVLSFVTIVLTSLVMFAFPTCNTGESPRVFVTEYPADMAIAWIKMQQRLFVGTPGLLPHVTGRTYAYTALTLYESLAPGMPDHQSIAAQLDGKLLLPSPEPGQRYHWPASSNSAVADILKKLLPHTTPKLLSMVDSLETAHYSKFQSETDAQALQRSVDFGRQIATAIFEWSKTDGGHKAYENPFSDKYVTPTGPGKWVATGEFPFSEPVYPYWGNNRTFIPGLADAAQPPPPPTYSEQPGSAFYNAVNEIYILSQHLSREDSMTAKFWGYELLRKGEIAEFDDASHAANIATQIIELKNLSLQDAAILYCKHGIAGNDAGIACVKTKFQYNVVRPITYIRTVLGHSEWRPLLHTPPFPEYTSAHAVISMAWASVLEDTFGANFAFTDHSFDDSYGPRSFDSFEAYAKEAALSRLQAGIHYRFSMDEGLKQGKKIAGMVNQLKFKK